MMMTKKWTLGNVLTKCSGIKNDGRLLTFEEVITVLNNYDEFSLKCQSKLRKPEFDYISDILYRLERYYQSKVDESIAAKKEIMKKYNIPGVDP